MKTKKLDVYYLVSLYNSEGITFEEMNDYLSCRGIDDLLIKYEFNLIRNSIEVNKINYSDLHNNIFRFFYDSKTGKYRPNIDYFVNNHENLVDMDANIFSGFHIECLPIHEDYYDLCTVPCHLQDSISSKNWLLLLDSIKKELKEKNIIPKYNQKKYLNWIYNDKEVSYTIKKIICERFGGKLKFKPVNGESVLFLDEYTISMLKVVNINDTPEKSKCEGSYFLIAWDWNKNKTNINFFVNYSFMNLDDWKKKEIPTMYHII